MSNNYFISVILIYLISLNLSKTIENESYHGNFKNSRNLSGIIRILDELYVGASLVGDEEKKTNYLIEIKKTDNGDFDLLDGKIVNRTKDYLRKINDKRFFFHTEENNGTNKTVDGILNKFIKNKTYFMDYKQVYGLRYDPNYLKKYLKNLTAEDEILGSTSNEVIFTNPTESYTINVTEIQGTSGLIDLTKDSLDKYENGEHHIMRPSRVQSTLDLITNRLKRLFKLGLDKSTPESEIILEMASPAKRFLNIFSIIRFENIPCSSTQKQLRQLNGTCYNKLECDQLGGISMDQCAHGFGVCCVFKLGCGQTTGQNVSYFENPGFPSSYREKLSCVITVELLKGVKQILLNFLIFEIKPPNDGTCLDDQFSVAGHNINQRVPIICGINTGQHMYINVENAVDNRLYLSILGSTVGQRIFSIRIIQLRENLAPQNCLQYYTSSRGTFQTFNYDDIGTVVQQRRPSYFNNLNYAICILRSAGHCSITYSNEINGIEYKMQLINVDQDNISVISSNQAGAEIYNCGDDYIAINSVRLCGEKLNDGSLIEDFTKNSPVTDLGSGPIVIPVKTNNAIVGRGFKLFYNQELCYNILK